MRKHLTFFRIYFYLFPPILILFICIQFYIALPPTHIVIEAGPKGGFFSSTAHFLKLALEKYGISAKVINVSDTTNIVRRLNNSDNDSHIGFIAQNLGDEKFENISSLGSVVLEPLLIFVRSDSGIDKISDLQGKKVAIGPVKSGVRVLGEEILSNYNINKDNTKFLPFNILDSAASIKSKESDAALFLLPTETQIIDELSKNTEFKILSFYRSAAIKKHYHFLTDVVIPKGGFSLKDNLPPRDILSVAMPVSLIIKKDFSTSLEVIVAYELKNRFKGQTLLTDKNTMPRNYLENIKMDKHVINLYEDGIPVFLQNLPKKMSLIVLGSVPTLSALILIYIIFGFCVSFVHTYIVSIELKEEYVKAHNKL